MSQKKVVCHGALCKCQFGDVPDTLTVLSQQKNYINDNAGSQKLVATDKELGMPFQAKTFGQCKLQPTGSSFKPCMPNITKWDGAFQKTQLKANQGYPLLEDSKATCAIAGSPCVEITFHGQTAGASSQNAENADEELLSQVLPINIKEIDKVSPYDAMKVSDSSEEVDTNDKTISVEIEVEKGRFVPLGIPDAEGSIENDKIDFIISIGKNQAEKMVIEILDGGKPYFKETITDPNKMSIGEHNWQWDGFDSWDNLNTEFLKSANLEAQVTVWHKGNQEMDIIPITKVIANEVDWVDVDIQRNIKAIQVTLRVNLKDGGAKGIKKANKVPKAAIKYYNKQPFTTLTRTFSDLEKLIIEGLKKHWSRTVKINNQKYDITIKAINTPKNSMDDVTLLYNTNSKPRGSSNPGTIEGGISLIGNIIAPERISYNVGYINFKVKNDPINLSGWRFLEPIDVDDQYKYLGAHEIGHTILKAFKGTLGSYKHNNSSTIFQQVKKGKKGIPYPSSGEIDVMKYYQNEPYFVDYSRTFATEEDVSSLIWLSKIKIR